MIDEFDGILIDDFLLFSSVDLFQSGKFSKNFQVKPPSELDQVQLALDKLLFMLKHLITYVDDVLVRLSTFFFFVFR